MAVKDNLIKHGPASGQCQEHHQGAEAESQQQQIAKSASVQQLSSAQAVVAQHQEQSKPG